MTGGTRNASLHSRLTLVDGTGSKDPTNSPSSLFRPLSRLSRFPPFSLMLSSHGCLLSARLSLAWALIIGLLSLSAGPAGAHSVPSAPSSWDDSLDTSTSAPPLPASWNRVSVWVGGASLNGRLIGTVPQSALGMLGVRYHRRLAPSPNARHSQGLTYTYTIDALPVVGLTIPDGTIPKTSFNGRTTFTEGVTTYGVGLSPIGLRLNYRTGARVEPYVAGSTGAVYFFQSLPDGRGKAMNFMVDAGVGLQIGLTSQTMLSVGYRYHHLSNGFRGDINPGIDSHLFHAGLTVVP